MNSILDISIRCIVVYLFMLIAIRLSGKKELSQLNTSDIVLILLISNAVQNAMVGADSSLLGGLTAAFVLFVLNHVLKWFLYRNKNLRDILIDKPHVLIHNGRLDFQMLSKLEISDEELQEAMREHGVAHYKEVKWAILEIDGNISIISDADGAKMTQYRRKKHHKNQIELS